MLRPLSIRSGLWFGLFALLLTTPPAAAQTDYYWNAPNGGDGTWNLTNENWATTAGGPVNYIWTNSGNERANFGDTNGTVTLGTGITAYGLNFTTGGYTITGDTLTLAGTGGPIVTGGAATINSVINGSVGLTKTGVGMLTLGGANTYTGQTTVAAGTLVLGTSNAIPTGERLQLGTFTGSGASAVSATGQTNFNLQGNSQTVNSFYSFNVNTAGTAHTVTIQSGESLTVSNNTTGIWTAFGAYNGTAGAVQHHLTFTGGGSFVVDTPSGTFQVGQTGGTVANQLPSGYPTASTQGSLTTVNMQGLSSFTANVTNFRVGDFTGGTNAGSATLNLAPTSTITAGDFVAASGRSGGAVAGTITVNLGTGTNTINANNIYIGGDVPAGISNPRSQGILQFGSTSGDLIVRAQNGTGAANLFLGLQRNGSGTFTRNNAINLNGHSVDMLLNTFQVGGFIGAMGTANTGNVTGTFSFDQGTVTSNTLQVGNRIGSGNQNNTAAAAGTVNIGGGTLTVTGSGAAALSIGNNTMTSTSTAGSGTQLTSGTVNVSGGLLSIPNGGITLATNTGTYAGGSATFETTGTLNITGGTVSVGGGDIVKGAATSPGTATATLTLNGATAVLNMNGNRIGGTTGAAAIDVLNFQAGTLSNVLEINSGAPLVKTSAGTLVLTGANGYTGGTTINDGTLLTNGQTGSDSGTGTGAVVVNNGGTFGGTGRAAGAVTVNQGGTIRGGDANGVGTLTIGGGLNFDLANGGNVGVRLTDGSTPSTTPGGSTQGTLPNPTSNNFVHVTNGGLNANPANLHFLVDGTGTAWSLHQAYSYQIGLVVGEDLSLVNITNPSQFTFVGFVANSVSLTGDAGGAIYLNFTPVPEPGTVLAFGAVGLGLAGLGRRLRRRKPATA
jgi:autotransporter-associated beta strand protein